MTETTFGKILYDRVQQKLYFAIFHIIWPEIKNILETTFCNIFH